MASSSRSGAVKTKLRGNPLLGGKRGKEPNKFQFDVLVERVIGGTSSADYSIKWCRGVKTASTKHFSANPKDPEGAPINQKLSLLCTLYRTKALDAIEFEPKDSKICIVSHKEGKKNDKTVGKVHFDLSKFAGVPSSSTAHTFELNAKTKVAVIITCTFVRVSRGTASSCGSGMSGMTVSSGEYDIGGNDDFADLDELAVPAEQDVDRMLSPISEAAWSPAAAAAEAPKPAMPALQNARSSLEVPRTDSERAVEADTPGTSTRKQRSSGILGMGSKAKEGRGTGIGSAFKSKSKIAGLESELERLQQELEDSKKETEKSRVLHQMSEDIIRELREKIEYSSGSGSNSAANREKGLQEKVDDLEKRIATASVEKKQLGQTYEARISTLKTQVEALERSKKRLEKESKTIKGQLETVESGRGSSAKEGFSSEAREKLLAELSAAREEKEKLEAQLDHRAREVSGLKTRNDDAETELQRLDAKLVAHEEHSEQVRSTFEELTKMYSDLRDDHTKLQASYSKVLASKSSEKDSPTSPKESPSKSRSSSFSIDKGRLMRKKNKANAKRDGNGDENSEKDPGKDTEEGEVLVAEQIHELKTELQEKRMALVEAERESLANQRETAGLRSDLQQAMQKLQQTRKEVSQLTERLEMAKSREINTNEQLDAAQVSKLEYQAELETRRKQHAQEMQKFRSEKSDEIRKLRQEIVEAAAAATNGDSSAQMERLEEALSQASQREDEYEKEILKLTQIMDGLANKLTEATKATEDQQDSETGSLSRGQSGRDHAGSMQRKSTRNVLLGKPATDSEKKDPQSMAPVCCEKCKGPIENQEGALERQQTKRPRGGGIASVFRMKTQVLGDPDNDKDGESFISSSKIRQMDLFEKITDGRLLNLLVETKMKLAIAEEEKLALEHLIRRVRNGDRHVQQKLAEHASKLEVKLNQANLMLENLRDESNATSSTSQNTEGQRAALKQFSTEEEPTSSSLPRETSLKQRSVLDSAKMKQKGNDKSAGTYKAGVRTDEGGGEVSSSNEGDSGSDENSLQRGSAGSRDSSSDDGSQPDSDDSGSSGSNG